MNKNQLHKYLVTMEILTKTEIDIIEQVQT
jgi:hypothetical protein